MNNISLITSFYEEHIATAKKSLEVNTQGIDSAAILIAQTIGNGGTLFICGNGGSAADAQHIAAEFTGRYKKERRSLPGIALTVDTSAITAIGNDYSFSEIFSRQLEGLGKENDVLMVISTSGNSVNCIRAVEQAKQMNIKTVGLLGKDGGKLAPLVDIAIAIPSDNTPRIQECHILVYHTICEVVDNMF